MEMVSRPVLEIMEGAIVVANRERVSGVTESPIKAGVGSAERAENKGVSCF
jgi:hypothetical protein